MGLLDRIFGSKNGAEAADFKMKVDMVFGIMGRGTVVAGMVETGAIQSGENVYFISPGGKRHCCRVEVELDQETHPGIQKAGQGMNVGLLLLGVERSEVAEGLMLYGRQP